MINLLHEVLQNYPKLFRLSILKPIFYHHTFHILRKSVLYLTTYHHPKVILQLYFGG